MSATVCRLCLQTISNNQYHTIKESMFKTLKLNQTVSDETVMCVECASCLQVFSKLGPGCVIVAEGTLPLSNPQNGVKLETVEIEATSNLQLMKTEIKCRFCTGAYGRDDLVSLNESNENKLMVNMLEQYISEMNLNNTMELLACASCLEALKVILGVILKCLNVEEKIREYIELEGTDDKGQIQLKEVQKFMLRPKVKLEIESVGIDDLEGGCHIKQENTAMAGLKIKYEEEISHPTFLIQTDDNIKFEQSNCDMTDIKLEKSDYDGLQEPFIKNNIPNDFFHIPVVTSETRKHNNKRPSQLKMFKCELCPYEAKTKNCLKIHLVMHKSPSELKMFKCELCPYKAKRRSNINQHLLTHKSPSELKMLKCELCPYEAKFKVFLKKHLLTHKSPSELKMFKCNLCPYEAKSKDRLKRHLLTHKSPSELKMFKCELCPYEAKTKNYLKIHLLIHKSPSELKMFKCDLCPYGAKHKDRLKKHLLIHKSPSELKMFKCEMCPYEAKLKDRLNMHLLTHKSPSELKMFQCELCSYEAVRKSNLQRHLLTHRALELKMFKCEICPYVANHKRSLKMHLLTHKSPSEIEMFKCTLCSYETKRKEHLVRHLLIHKSPSNSKIFKCKLCSYVVKSKFGLKSHLSTHESPN